MYEEGVEGCADSFRRRAEEALALLSETPDSGFKEHHRGGYLILRDRKTGRVLRIWKIGDPPAERADAYVRYSMEKGIRLFRNPDHVSSWESRDLETERYGGAVITENFILSFSGLPEHGDEVVVLYVAHCLELLNGDAIDRVLGISTNDLYWKALNQRPRFAI